MIRKLEDNERYLPYSARRYVISSRGIIRHATGETIDPYEKDGHLVVDINWINGPMEYRLAMLVIKSFSCIEVPEHHLVNILPLYRDGDCKNVKVSNLGYRFDKPIESEIFEGYYYVPGFSRYVINKDGELINSLSGKELKWARTKENTDKGKGGYSYCRVVDDFGMSNQVFRHRALCLTFKDYGNEVFNRVVNHLDGEPTNDSLDNIEWATYSENIIHAYETGLRGDSMAVLVKDVDTGEINKYRSLSQAAEALGYKRTCEVAKRIRNQGDSLYPDRKIIKYDDGSSWPLVDPNKILRKPGLKQVIAARNVFTGKVVLFDNGLQAERALGIKSGTILSHVRKREIIPFRGYNFRYYRESESWPVFTPQHIKIFKMSPERPGNAIVANDTITGAKIFLKGPSVAQKAFRLSKSGLYSAISNGNIVNKRYLLSFFLIKDGVRSEPVRQSLVK